MCRFTLVEDISIAKKVRHRLRFGCAKYAHIQSNAKRIFAFEPSQIFAYVRWTRSEYGTEHWSVIIAQASRAGRVTDFPGIYPGADILFRARGKTASKRALIWIDRLEKSSDDLLENVHASFWRRAENARIRRKPLPVFGSPSDHFCEPVHA